MAKPSNRPAPLAGQIIAGFVMLAVMLPLVGSKFITTQIQKEQGLTLRFYGDLKGTLINTRADNWFRIWAIESGLLDRAVHAFDRNPASTQTAAGVDPNRPKPLEIHDSAGRFASPTAGTPAGGQSNGSPRLWHWWITAVFALMYFAALRLSELVTLTPMLLPLIIAVVITGGSVQKLKWHSFGGVSALHYRVGIRLWGWMLGIGVGLLFAPGALPPVTVGACLLLSFGGMAMMTANRQKPI